MKLRTLLMTVCAASTLLLSGCWINETSSSNSGSNGNGGSAQTTTVSSFAASNINTATCTNTEPEGINSVTFVVPDDTQTDVSTLTPACSP